MTSASISKVGLRVQGHGPADKPELPRANSSLIAASAEGPLVVSESARAEADHWYQQGSLLVSQRRLDEAVTCYQRACGLRPDFPEALNCLGFTLGLLGKYEEAFAALKDALRFQPDDFATLVNLSIPLLALDRNDEAIGFMERALEVRPDSAELCNNLGVVLKKQGKLTSAVDRFLQALQLKPNFTKAYVNLAATLVLNKQPEAAATCYREAIRLQPDDAETHNALGFALVKAGLYDQAELSYLRALELKPDFVEAIGNLGNMYSETSRVEEALVCFQKVIRYQSNHAEAYNDMGLALERGRQYAQAHEYYAHAVRLKPDYAIAHTNRAMLWLKTGQYEQGWSAYEWRWRLPDAKPPRFPQPAWNGEPLEGRTILLCTEQGYGDTIQFIRFAPLLKERGAVVILRCARVLVPFLEGLPIFDAVVAEEEEALPPFDTYCTLMSLPRVLGTTLETIPVDIPYLHADPERVTAWARELDAMEGLRVGITWQGSPSHQHDHIRSIPLKHFAPLAELKGVRLCSLQRGRGTEQLSAFTERYEITDLGGRIDEENGVYVDRAAMMMNLDLVIAADTGIAHVAGALGVPCWVALPWQFDWRWLEQRDDSPWYPTLRVFRQSRSGDWDELFQRIATTLQAAIERPVLRQSLFRDLRTINDGGVGGPSIGKNLGIGTA